MRLRTAMADRGFSTTGMATSVKQDVVVVCLPSLRESQDPVAAAHCVHRQLDG
jgi:hypothetical protein